MASDDSNSLWSSGAYAYDSASNILKMGTSDLFGYDSRSRLASATYSGTTRTFGAREPGYFARE